MKSFEFFDKKNRARVHNIKTCILNQKDNLNNVNNIMNNVKRLIQENETVLIDYEEMSKKLEICKSIKAEQRR